MRKLFTSESVTEGHPDKMCDQISDAILDEIIRKDPYSRVACETVVTTGMVMVMGEISTKASIDFSKIVRNTIKEIGYTDDNYGFNYRTCSVITAIEKQSKDIALGVDVSLETKMGSVNGDDSIGAGDQGMMFGYATNETSEYMPMPISLAHKLARRLTEVRKNGMIKYLRPDGKTQVTIEYEDEKPIRVDTIIVSAQHSPYVTQQQMRKDIIEKVIKPVVPAELLDKGSKYLINPTGRFVIGGPMADCGAYAARWIAKNMVTAGIADRMEIQLAYAIGTANPVSITVDTFRTGKIADDISAEIIKRVFNLTPSGIIKDLNLRTPIYKKIAAYGHFGRNDLALPWERLNMVSKIIECINKDIDFKI